MSITYKHVIIIGGGLGGLLLCQSLNAAGINATVFERDAAPESREQGYYIGINPDGAKALSHIQHPEIADLLLEQREINCFNVVDNRLWLLAHLNFGSTLKVAGSKEVTPGLVNRVVLREYLTHGIEDRIVWNKRFVRYIESKDRVIVEFEDGTTVEGDLVVGADGANSRVRSQRCPDLKTETIPIASFAAVIRSPDESQIPRLMYLMRDSMLRVLGLNGHTILAGVINMKGEKCLFYALSHPNNSEPLPSDPEVQRKIYEQKSTFFHPEIQRMMRMPSEIIMFRELQAVKPLPYNPLLKSPSTRVTLLGDAAHAMTTHRGLGANTAFQDAVDLANGIVNGNLVPYETILFTRGFKAVKGSRQSTDSIHSKGLRSCFVWLLFYVIGWIMWIREKLFWWKK